MMVLLSWFSPIVLAQDALPTNTATIYSSLKARKFKVVLLNKKAFSTKSLDSLKGNTLYIYGKNGPEEVSLEIIKELQVAKRQRPIARGLGLGVLIGASTGALLGFGSYQEPEPNSYFTFDLGPGASAGAGAALGAVTGIVGGIIIGASSNRYTHYDFSQKSLTEKYDLMSRILEKK
ncbi:hypothetical protein [Adhaeribacter radiodurans]|uniref:Uncharacterized protein n=1 Tax=Adhaeribacter radiodurans TaxID=2745197 RepID=A0A7L7L4Q5_9BACT|nr:hypothetical protein [Adhaeribacter radiodurans]QMU27754.1 hypothetical protein HUW48_06715 [Adhaeribacter radiodurans]